MQEAFSHEKDRTGDDRTKSERATRAR